ncbi:unnamed protein product [Cylindrotheca closterium]|uniref:Uncharacterized protein n=1 Tax=Cylindrotheca closterium TaxID=2856 RepID=A0AAD2G8F9_9STRA|nr:unnamed protein product [Cylindrotheca closterium]
MAFASPPVWNHKAAEACSSFITTIVNNSDCIPRSSLNNVAILMELLSGVQEKLTEAGIDCKDMKSTAVFMAKLREGTGGAMIMTPEEGAALLQKSQTMVSRDAPDHLYVLGGEVVLLYQKWQDKKKRNEAKDREEKGEKKVAEPPLPAYSVITDGFTACLNMIEISNDMVGDHLCGAYRLKIKNL